MKFALPVMGFFVMVLLPAISSAPASPDYESVRELYEVLMGRDPQAADLWAGHRLVRKNSNRSPQLRLRFGRRSDPAFMQLGDHGMEHNMFDSLDN
uniref:Neuropeptide n=1 Tax=Nezara viridula TaxID=85310 RepID=A0A3S8RK80_NEZVI|nr:neuropeptide precursor [Nezara viridula]